MCQSPSTRLQYPRRGRSCGLWKRDWARHPTCTSRAIRGPPLRITRRFRQRRTLSRGCLSRSRAPCSTWPRCRGISSRSGRSGAGSRSERYAARVGVILFSHTHMVSNIALDDGDGSRLGDDIWAVAQRWRAGPTGDCLHYDVSGTLWECKTTVPDVCV